jgi:biopolymer transport protein ExbD
MVTVERSPSPAGMPVELPARRKRRRSVESADMDITPMIDVTFLLLIFFLVASNMTPGRDVQLPQARNGTAVPQKETIILTVAAPPTQDALARIFRGDGKAPEALIEAVDAKGQEQAIEDYIRQQLDASPTHRRVLVKAERTVKHRDVARVARVASGVGNLPLFVGVEEIH